ncbi:unnamed protein product [Alopecurus aequalis]
MSGGGGNDKDLLTFLPDDILHEIPLRLCSTNAAARTSLLSRNWRNLWTQIPDLQFHGDLAHVGSALSAYAATILRSLRVTTLDVTPKAVEAILVLAAPLLTGEISIENVKEVEDDHYRSDDSFELPCFHKATEIYLDLFIIGLELPASGVFLKLVSLCLHNMWLDGLCNLGEVVSSARCPLLQYLDLDNIFGLTNLTIHSKSLLCIELSNVEELQQITIVAPMLDSLYVDLCFVGIQPMVDISAPALRIIHWHDNCDMSWSKLKMVRLMNLSTTIAVYGPTGCRPYNKELWRLFQHFQAISILELQLMYPHIMDNCEYWLEAITMLPFTKTLSLELSTNGHVFGPCVFYLLSMSTRIRNLKLEIKRYNEKRTTCPSGCICSRPEDMETDVVLLNSLMEVEIIGLSGVKHEITFVE